jgi:tetratricopeptide (TPR) repeat protein
MQCFYVAQALQANPRFVDAILFEGITWYEMGRREDGLARINHACQLDPLMCQEEYQRALQCHVEDDFSGTVRHLLNLCCTSSADASLHIRLGDSYSRVNDPARAVEEYQKAIAAAPDHAEAHWRLGKELIAVDRAHDAVEHLTLAIRLNPGNAEAHAQLGLAYEALQRNREASNEFQQVFKLNPDHPLALRFRRGYAV